MLAPRMYLLSFADHGLSTHAKDPAFHLLLRAYTIVDTVHDLRLLGGSNVPHVSSLQLSSGSLCSPRDSQEPVSGSRSQSIATLVKHEAMQPLQPTPDFTILEGFSCCTFQCHVFELALLADFLASPTFYYIVQHRARMSCTCPSNAHPTTSRASSNSSLCRRACSTPWPSRAQSPPE